MKKYRKLAALLACAMCVTAAPLHASAAEFSDARGHWAYDAIDRWSDYGIIQGARGLVKPDGNMTRAEMSTVLVKLLGLTDLVTPEDELDFHDMEDDQWYDDAIYKCNTAGLLKGDSNGNANPNKNITREEAAVILARSLGISPVNGHTNFADSGDIGAWSEGYVKAMNDAGYIRGTERGFLPQSPITRAEVLTVLDNAISNYAKEDGASIQAKGAGITLIAAKNVTITGTLNNKVYIAAGAKGGTVTLRDVNVFGGVTMHAGATLIAAGTTEIGTVTIDKEAAGAKVTVAPDASIQTIDTAASGVTIDGEGELRTVNVATTGTKTTISTTNTNVNVKAAGVTYGGVVVPINSDSTTSISNIIPATLTDAKGDYDQDEVVTDYKVVTKQAANSDFSTITITTTDLKYHKNKYMGSEMGYWCGVALPVPNGASPTRTRYSTDEKEFDDSTKQLGDTAWSTMTTQKGASINGSFLPFYFDRTNDAEKVYLTVEWRDTNGSIMGKYQYLVDMTGVKMDSIKATFKTAITNNSALGSVQTRQLATALGLTASTTDTKLTLTGTTTLDKIRASNGYREKGNGYVLVALNINNESDSVGSKVKYVQCDNYRDEWTTYSLSDYSSTDASLKNAVFLPIKFYHGSDDNDDDFVDKEVFPIILLDKDKKEIGKIGLTVDADKVTYTDQKTNINITTQPKDSTITVGATAPVSVTATVTPAGTLTYQWVLDGYNINGATTASYTIPADRLGVGTHRVYCTVSASDQSYNSNSAFIIVNAKAGTAPSITIKSSSPTSPINSTIVLSAAVTEAKDLTYTYSWMMDGVSIGAGVSNGNSTGNSLTYLIPAATAGGDHQFSCKVTATGAGVTSAEATSAPVTVKIMGAKPVITPPPGSAIPADASGSTALDATATVTEGAALAYQWTVSTAGGSIENPTSASCILKTAPPGSAEVSYRATCTITAKGTDGQEADPKTVAFTVTVPIDTSGGGGTP